jgi:hypothetical protein
MHAQLIATDKAGFRVMTHDYHDFRALLDDSWSRLRTWFKDPALKHISTITVKYADGFGVMTYDRETLEQL